MIDPVAKSRRERRALRAINRVRRSIRKGVSPAVRSKLEALSVLPLQDSSDQAFVVHMKRTYADRNGLPYVAWDNAMYFVCKHKITGEHFGCMAVNALAPLGNYFIGDFFTVDGKPGRLAAIAMFETLHTTGKPSLGLVAVSNQKMETAVKNYGWKKVATLYQFDPPGEEAKVI
jgi:hypothetical protein